MADVSSILSRASLPAESSRPGAAVSGATAGQLFVGIDLAWSTGWTGLAVVDGSGRLVDSGRARPDHEIADWVQRLPGPVAVVAVDAPLVVPNESGQRPAERLIGRAFGAFGASAHTANRGTFGGREARAMTLARRLGWEVDPAVTPGEGRTLCLEVYPHPAMVGLFALPYRLDYKKGSTARRLPGFRALAELLESVPELDVAGSARWVAMRAEVAHRRPGVLGRWEDEVDAILCAHLAWRWVHRPGSLVVYGTARQGYIVAPPPPTHRAVRPAP